MNVTRNADQTWTIKSATNLTDTEAASIEFWAEPRDVYLGEFVEVVDPEGSRIGHVGRIELVPNGLSPARVRCALSLL